MPDPILALKVLLLLLAANGSPVLGKRLLGSRLAVPIDGGGLFIDGRPLLGPSKTVRGLLLSLAVTALVAVLLGLPWSLGAGFAAASMAGDLLSSFIKRRLSVPSSGQALGLDQIPEALLPIWLYREALGVDAWGVLLLVGLFTVGELLLSRVMFRLGIRDRPY
ncbi:MAG: CDP-archaeol synthase [Pseudomonadales bacterium]